MFLGLYCVRDIPGWCVNIWQPLLLAYCRHVAHYLMDSIREIKSHQSPSKQTSMGVTSPANITRPVSPLRIRACVKTMQENNSVSPRKNDDRENEKQYFFYIFPIKKESKMCDLTCTSFRPFLTNPLCFEPFFITF